MIVLPKGNNNNYDKLNTHREMVKTNGIIETTITWNKLQQPRQLQQSLSQKSHTPLCSWQVFKLKMSASVVHDNRLSHCLLNNNNYFGFPSGYSIHESTKENKDE